MSLKRKINPHVIGILYILTAALCFSLMTFFVKLSGDLPTMEKAFFRNLVASGLAIFMLARSEEKFKIQKGNGWLLLWRSVFGTLGLIMNFWAIDHLGLADSNILNKMSPVFAMLMSIFLLSELPTAFEWGTVAVAFIGAAFVIKPSLGIASLPALVGLCSGFCAGTAYTFVRKLGLRGERGPVIVMCFSVFSCLVCLPFMVLNFKPMTIIQLIFLLCAGFSAMGGQLGITAAYTHAPAKNISVFDYSQVIFAGLWGFLFFDEIPDRYSVIGYILIIGTAVAKWYYNLHKDESDAVGEK